MNIDPQDPKHHGGPLWIVYGERCFPSLLCAKLIAYSATHQRLPAGEQGAHVCIWGYSVWKNEPKFRTLGINVEEWSERSGMAPEFYTEQDEAIERLRRMTKPKEAALRD